MPAHRIAAALTIVACAAMFLLVAIGPPALSGDSIAVENGLHVVLECLGDGKLTHCSESRGPEAGDAVGPFPVLQYLIALPFSEVFGSPQDDILVAFSVISVLALLGLVLLCWRLGTRLAAPFAAPLLALTVLASPLLYYSRATFSEMLATALMAAAVAAALCRSRALLLFPAVFAAALTKETVFPFVVLLVGVALWFAPEALHRGRALTRRTWVVAAAAVASALLVHALFNIFRYGVPFNETYGEDAGRVEGVVLKAKLGLALWASPNGGTALFWPLIAVIGAAAIVLAVVGLRRDHRDLRGWLPAAGVVAAIAAQTAVLSAWWAPFGWFAWGPRLMLPVLPAAALLLVATHTAQLQAAATWLGRSRARVAAIAAVVTIAAVPHVALAATPGLDGVLFTTDATCPVEPDRAAMTGEYFRCLTHRAWRREWILPVVGEGIDQNQGPWMLLALGGALVSLTVAATRPQPAAPRGGDAD